MLGGISGGVGLQVYGGIQSNPYITPNQSNPMQGMLRLCGSDMQAFDGVTWITVSGGHATVEMDVETRALLQWARGERDTQLRRDSLVANNPALQKAFEAVQRAEANFDLLEKFVENDNG